MTVSDPIHRGAEPCRHPDTYRCADTCECLCPHCWDKRHVGDDPT